MTKPHDFSTCPPWAAYVWADRDAIWLQLPCPVGKAPVLVQYPRSEAGFAKAVALVEQCANIKSAPPPAGWFKHAAPPSPPKLPIAKRSKKPTILDNASTTLLEALKKVMS